MSSTFAQLGVPAPIVDALALRGIDSPFAIQAATVKDALAGRDVCGRAPTGSGKTIAFGIPLSARTQHAQARRPRSLVLAPTRELADQIADEIRTFSDHLRVGVVYGGVGYGPQIKALRAGVDLLVACPGRLEDLIADDKVLLGDVDMVVIDEADRMADMGFLPAVRRLLDQTSPDRQTLLFSATLDGDIATLTRDYQHDPVRHEVGEETPDITLADHRFWRVERTERIDVTAELLTKVWPAIVFCRTRHGADRLAKQLSKRGVKAAPIHGGRSQAQRTRALKDFAANKVEALIATDVAARGIHVDGVAVVVQFDPPEDHKTYIHRAGRTARAGSGGLVVSLVQPDQVKDTTKMQRKAGLDSGVTAADIESVDATEPAPRRPEPESGQRGGQPAPSHDNRPSGGGNRGAKRPARSGGKANARGAGGRSGKNRSPGRPRRSDERAAGDATGERREGSRPQRSKPAGRKTRSGAGGGGAKNGAPKGRNGRKTKSTGKGESPARSTQGSGGTKPATPGGPNRKARRAHLQRPS
ncbi:MAG: DEAD/DEAH box helicase [Actinomycetota bacterium]